jgi:acyl carrier protein
MSEAEFIARLARIGRISTEVTDASPIRPAEWDSVELLDLIAAVDEAYGVTVPTADMTSCTTVGELRALIHRASAGA